MRSAKARIRDLLARIDRMLQAEPSFHASASEEAALEWRRSLERVRASLAGLEGQAGAIEIFGGEEDDREWASVPDAEVWQRQILEPLQAELSSLQEERQNLQAEIRQLEARRHNQYSLAQQQAHQQKVVETFARVLMERLQQRLVVDLSESVRRIEARFFAEQMTGTGPEAQLVGDEAIASMPLHPAERLERMRVLQSRSDNMLQALDRTFQVVFETLLQNAQSYSESMAATVSQMHGLGEQSKVLFEAWIEMLTGKLQQEVLREAEDDFAVERETALPADASPRSPQEAIAPTPSASAAKLEGAGTKTVEKTRPVEKKAAAERIAAEKEAASETVAIELEQELSAAASEMPASAAPPETPTETSDFDERVADLFAEFFTEEEPEATVASPAEPTAGETAGVSPASEPEADEADATDDDELFRDLFGSEDAGIADELDSELDSELGGDASELGVGWFDAGAIAPEETEEAPQSVLPLDAYLFAEDGAPISSLDPSEPTTPELAGMGANAETIARLTDLFGELGIRDPKDEGVAAGPDSFIPASPDESLMPSDSKLEIAPKSLSLSPIVLQQLQQDLSSLEGGEEFAIAPDESWDETWQDFGETNELASETGARPDLQKQEETFESIWEEEPQEEREARAAEVDRLTEEVLEVSAPAQAWEELEAVLESEPEEEGREFEEWSEILDAKTSEADEESLEQLDAALARSSREEIAPVAERDEKDAELEGLVEAIVPQEDFAPAVYSQADLEADLELEEDGTMAEADLDRVAEDLLAVSELPELAIAVDELENLDWPETPEDLSQDSVSQDSVSQDSVSQDSVSQDLASEAPPDGDLLEERESLDLADDFPQELAEDLASEVPSEDFEDLSEEREFPDLSSDFSQDLPQDLSQDSAPDASLDDLLEERESLDLADDFPQDLAEELTSRDSASQDSVSQDSVSEDSVSEAMPDDEERELRDRITEELPETVAETISETTSATSPAELETETEVEEATAISESKPLEIQREVQPTVLSETTPIPAVPKSRQPVPPRTATLSPFDPTPSPPPAGEASPQENRTQQMDLFADLDTPREGTVPSAPKDESATDFFAIDTSRSQPEPIRSEQRPLELFEMAGDTPQPERSPENLFEVTSDAPQPISKAPDLFETIGDAPQPISKAPDLFEIDAPRPEAATTVEREDLFVELETSAQAIAGETATAESLFDSDDLDASPAAAPAIADPLFSELDAPPAPERDGDAKEELSQMLQPPGNRTRDAIAGKKNAERFPVETIVPPANRASAPVAPNVPQKQPPRDWHLGLDFNADGLSAVLCHRDGRRYPLYWQYGVAEGANHPGLTFCLPAAIATSTPLPADWKSLLNLALPWQDGDRWEPVLQWSDPSSGRLRQRAASLHDLRCAARDLFATLGPNRDRSLEVGAFGLEPDVLHRALSELGSAIVSCPAGWTEAYRFNLREAAIAAGLTDVPERVIFVEDSIAALLSELPVPGGSPGYSGLEVGAMPPWQGKALVLKSGAIATEFALVDLPEDLGRLRREDFALTGFPYGGSDIDRDILLQLLVRDNPFRSLAEDLDFLEIWPPPGEPSEPARSQLHHWWHSSPRYQNLRECVVTLKQALRERDGHPFVFEGTRRFVRRRELDASILVPFVQHLNRELNDLLSRTGTDVQAIRQAVCTGDNASWEAIARWLRRKLPNATIVQDTYSDRPLSSSRIAYGLATVPFHPQAIARRSPHYEDFFLLQELLQLPANRAWRSSEIFAFLERRGTHVRACTPQIPGAPQRTNAARTSGRSRSELLARTRFSRSPPGAKTASRTALFPATRRPLPSQSGTVRSPAPVSPQGYGGSAPKMEGAGDRDPNPFLIQVENHESKTYTRSFCRPLGMLDAIARANDSLGSRNRWGCRPRSGIPLRPQGKRRDRPHAPRHRASPPGRPARRDRQTERGNS